MLVCAVLSLLATLDPETHEWEADLVTSLHEVSKAGNVVKLKALLDAGADVNAASERGYAQL